MLNVRLAGCHLYGEIAVHLAVAGNVLDGVFLCCPFSDEMSWMKSWTLLSQFLRVFLPTLPHHFKKIIKIILRYKKIGYNIDVL